MGVININQINRYNDKAVFFVDTNVWINCFFDSSKSFNEKSQRKSRAYLEFFEKIKNNGGEIVTSSICYSETFSVIEKQYLGSFEKKNGLHDVKLKDYRKHSSYSRELIINDNNLLWSDVLIYISKIIPFIFDDGARQKISSNLANNTLDAHDAVYLDIMSTNNIRNIITEDSDFDNIQNIDVYHA